MAIKVKWLVLNIIRKMQASSADDSETLKNQSHRKQNYGTENVGLPVPKLQLHLKGLFERSQENTPTVRSPGTLSGISFSNNDNQIESFLSRLVDKVDDSQLEPNSSITVDISGKQYTILNSQLFMNPDSLLARPEREYYLDTKTGHYYFDRNRSAFDLVQEYYQRGGRLRTPDFLSERLLRTEFTFFGLMDEDSTISSIEEDDSDFTDSSEEDEGLGSRLHNFLNEPASSWAAKTWMLTDVCLIFFSMVHFLLDTKHDIFYAHVAKENYIREVAWELANIFSVAFFTTDLFARFFVAPCKLRFSKQVTNWFDLIAILPFYIDGLLESVKVDPFQLKIFQLFRIARVARVLKVVKRSRRLLVIGMILYECLNELAMLFVFWGMGVFFSGSLMYFCEHHEEGTFFVSILSSCWWSVVTMSTLGYGDMVPATLLGKLLGAIIIFASTVFMAVPMTIIVTKFGECYEKMKKEMGTPQRDSWREKRDKRSSNCKNFCSCSCQGVKKCC